MTTIALATYVLKACLLQIAADNYEKHVAAATLAPTVNGQTFKAIDGSVTRDTSVPEWTLTLDYAQDWTTANSLAAYLLANVGTQKTIILSPLGSAVGKPKFTVDVMIVPGPVGGKVDDIQTASVTLVCIGQPVKATW